MTSRVACLDALGNTRISNLCPRPRVQRHQPDIDNLLEQMKARTSRVMEEQTSRYVYVNPIVTIICDEPTSEFFSLIRKRQAEWCSRSRTIFSRRLGRRVKNWFTVEREQTKFEKFMSRGLQFTGLLFIKGQPVPQDQWPLPTR